MAIDHNPYDSEARSVADKKRDGLNLSARAQWESDVLWLMSGTRGRRVVAHLLKEANVGGNPFSPNALEMSKNCGHLKLGTELEKVIKKVALREFHAMELEHGTTNE